MTNQDSTPTKPCRKCGKSIEGKNPTYCKRCHANNMAEWRGRKPRIDPSVERLPVTKKELTSVFSRVVVNAEISYNGSLCWLWTSYLNHNGYARIYYRGYQHQGHRLLYQIFVGKIADANQGDHLCRVRNCINPAHVDDVSGRINTLRGENVAAKNARKTHCKYGHEFTPENTYWKKHKGNLTRVCLTCRRRDGVERWHKQHPNAPYRKRSENHRAKPQIPV